MSEPDINNAKFAHRMRVRRKEKIRSGHRLSGWSKPALLRMARDLKVPGLSHATPKKDIIAAIETLPWRWPFTGEDYASDLMGKTGMYPYYMHRIAEWLNDLCERGFPPPVIDVEDKTIAFAWVNFRLELRYFGEGVWNYWVDGVAHYAMVRGTVPERFRSVTHEMERCVSKR